MNYEMDNKEIMCTDAMLVTVTQFSYNSAVADVKDGSRPIRWGRKEIKTQLVSPSIEQRNCNNVEHSGGLRPLEPGSRDILPRKRIA